MGTIFTKLGPATLISAAFIGPGTVTVCILAGVNYGFDLLWAMVFSIIATIVLQEMSARTGLISKMGLTEVIRAELKSPIPRVISILLIMSAIIIGNAAYEAGNISGAVMGIQALAGREVIIHKPSAILIISGIAFTLLYMGRYKVLERGLTLLVGVMSIAFVIAAISTNPNIIDIVKGIFVPRLPDGSTLTAISIVGTTVVPYNLFLHASLVKEKWQGASNHLSDVRKDLYLSISLGGLISLAIIIASASLKAQEVSISNVIDLTENLESVLGSFSKYLIGVGLVAAGITSAITAPLAAAFVGVELMGYPSDMRSQYFRIFWISILALGCTVSLLGYKPIEVIKYAQFTNGLLLPILAGFLLWIVNKRSVMKHHRNSNWQNVISLLVLGVTLVLGIKSILSVFALL